MVFHPIIDFRATRIWKAFILNAIVLACIATASIELRRYLDVQEETKGLSTSRKVFITMLGTFLIGIIIYISIRLIFGFGEGLMACEPFSKSFLF
tara:strand:- start:50 stop:334 length:285 start_codon:yes stop_codon:yes gene_type:complete